MHSVSTVIKIFPKLPVSLVIMQAVGCPLYNLRNRTAFFESCALACYNRLQNKHFFGSIVTRTVYICWRAAGISYSTSHSGKISISVSCCEGLGFTLLSLMLSLICGLADSAFILEGVIAREANLIN